MSCTYFSELVGLDNEKEIRITAYVGPERCRQMTQLNVGMGVAFLTPQQARDLALALLLRPEVSATGPVADGKATWLRWKTDAHMADRKEGKVRTLVPEWVTEKLLTGGSTADRDTKNFNKGQFVGSYGQ